MVAHREAFRMNPLFRASVVLFVLCGSEASANDWPRFRGPAGSGIATDSESVPTFWSATENLAWKSPLPGPGASSPIIVGRKVFVTCWSGYGLDRENAGKIENLVRHLVCIDRATGETLWTRDVPASLPEDPYDKSGVSSHGYSSHTPVSDGTSVFCFFGKGGVHAFDLRGNKLWSADAGKESDPPRWGSSSSPVVYRNTVIVTASAESQSIIGFDKMTGEKQWQQEATGLDGMWGTPTLVPIDEDRTDLVMLVAKEHWGLDPGSGKLRWYADATSSAQAYTSVVAEGTRIFACSGQGGGSLALDLSRNGGITKADAAWTSTVSATYASPALRQSKLYVISRGVLSVVDAKSGDRIQQIRLRGAKRTGNARFGSLDYASPVVVGDRLFYLCASGQMFVFRIGDDEASLLSVNELTPEKEVFWGSPAVSDGRMVIRSSRHIYCVADDVTDKRGKQATSLRATVPPKDTPAESSGVTDSEDALTGGRSPHLRQDEYNRASDKNPGRQTRPKRPRRPQSVHD